MAPVKQKSATITAAAVDRMVDVVLNLETEVSEIKEELRSCKNIITGQQTLLTHQYRCIQTILNVLTNSHQALNIVQHSSLNDSGPAGIICLNGEPPAVKKLNTSLTGQSLEVPTGAGPPVVHALVSPVPTPRMPRARDTNHGPQPASATYSSAAAHESAASSSGHVPPGPLRDGGAGAASLVGKPSKSVELRAAPPRHSSLHVFNLSHETTSDNILQHIASKMAIKDATCVKLNVTRGQYSSFHLDVPG